MKEENNDINIEEMSLSTSSNNDLNINNNNSNEIGLDLLANSKKMSNIKSNQFNDNVKHDEIDLDKNNITNQDEIKDNLTTNIKLEHSNSDNSTSDSDSDDDDDDDNDNNNDYIPENVPHVNNFNNYQSKEQLLENILDEKKKILFELERLKKRGIPISKQYSLASNIDEMKTEFENIKKQREVENSVMFSRKMLMAIVTAIEFLNNRFDPFELKLDGWSENVHESVHEYDDIFEELHEKYKSTGKMAPELKLLLTLGGSAFMFHLTNNIFKSSMPQFQNAAVNNPDIINNMMNKSNKSSNNTNSSNMKSHSNSGGGFDIGSILGMLSGMGGGGPQSGGFGSMPDISAMANGLGNMQNNIPTPSGIIDDNMAQFNTNDKENIINKNINKKSMNGPQGVETLLETLSSNTKPVIITKNKKKGLNL